MSVGRLGFVGFGALGRQVRTWLAETGDAPAEIVAFDDEAVAESGLVIAPFASFLDADWADLRFVAGVGYQHLGLRRRIVADLLAGGRELAAVRHPSASVSPSAQLGAGTIVCPGACIDQHAIVGDGAIIHCGAVICHDAVIGAAAYLGPGSVICGRARVGASTFIGAGALVADHRSVGEEVRIGIGSVVTRDVMDGVSAIGNPLRELDRPLRL